MGKLKKLVAEIRSSHSESESMDDETRTKILKKHVHSTQKSQRQLKCVYCDILQTFVYLHVNNEVVYVAVLTAKLPLKAGISISK